MNPLVVRDHDNKGYITYAVDFDGCLCKSAYPVIGEPNHKLIGYLARERARGNKVILWTARTGKSLQDAIDWCKEQGLVFDWINEGGSSNNKDVWRSRFTNEKGVCGCLYRRS